MSVPPKKSRRRSEKDIHFSGENQILKPTLNFEKYWELPEDELFGLFDLVDGVRRARHNNFVSIMFKWPPFARDFFNIFLDESTKQSLILDKPVVMDSIFTQQEDLNEYRGDILYKVSAIVQQSSNNCPSPYHTSIGLLLEHKAQPDYFVIRQAKKYVDLFHESEETQAIKDKTFDKNFKFTIIIPIVLYQGSGRFCGPVNYRDLFPSIPGLEPYIEDFKMVLIDVNAITASMLEKSKNNPELWFVLRILRAIFRKDLKNEMNRLFRDIRPFVQSKEQGKRYRSFARLLVQYIIQSASQIEPEDIKKSIEENFAQGEPAMKTVADKLIDQGIAIGKQRGWQEGRQEGRFEGILAGIVQSIVLALEAKKIRVTLKVRKRLNQIKDEVVLNSLFQSALCCTTLKEFESELP